MRMLPGEASPSISLKAFVCPHCGAFADQPWFNCFATQLSAPPQFLDPVKIAEAIQKQRDKNSTDLDLKLSRAEKMAKGEPRFFDEKPRWTPDLIDSVHVSSCASCKQLAVWVGKSMVYPTVALTAVAPNEDLPDEIKNDFQEARKIVSISPRGAAALLRLCVQKLCKHLGESGTDVNNDIASLVRKGLAPLIQQALDTVRVVGNEAVHPGQLDLRDDKETAIALFGLVNLIAEQLISTPKHVQDLYSKLPAKKLDGIAQRDRQRP